METFSHGTLDPWYVTGFADGEGSFTYSRSGRQMGLYFAIKLTAEEEPILQRLQEFLGVGRIYNVVARKPSGHGGWTKTARYYRVTRRDDLVRIIEHFDQYPLQTEKLKSYVIWRQMVLLKQQSFRNPDREKLQMLAEKLSACCIRKQEWK